MLIQAQVADKTGLLTNHQIKNEILNLFAAGYEVTAHTLAFTLYLISQNPEVEARLFEEIDILSQRAIATSLQNYRLTVAPGYHFETFYSFNTRPKNGLRMTVKVK